MTSDKRHAERIPHPSEVQCILADGLTIASTRLSDLSTHGAFVESLNVLPLGTALRLRFLAGERLIDVGGRVVQVMPQFGFGLNFDDLAPEDEAAISALVARKS